MRKPAVISFDRTLAPARTIRDGTGRDADTAVHPPFGIPFDPPVLSWAPRRPQGPTARLAPALVFGTLHGSTGFAAPRVPFHAHRPPRPISSKRALPAYRELTEKKMHAAETLRLRPSCLGHPRLRGRRTGEIDASFHPSCHLRHPRAGRRAAEAHAATPSVTNFVPGCLRAASITAESVTAPATAGSWSAPHRRRMSPRSGRSAMRRLRMGETTEWRRSCRRKWLPAKLLMLAWVHGEDGGMYPASSNTCSGPPRTVRSVWTGTNWWTVITA